MCLSRTSLFTLWYTEATLLDELTVWCVRAARSNNPFKPRNTIKGTSSYQLRQFAEATLGSGSLRKAVQLPDGEDINEWLAVNGSAA